MNSMYTVKVPALSSIDYGFRRYSKIQYGSYDQERSSTVQFGTDTIQFGIDCESL